MAHHCSIIDDAFRLFYSDTFDAERQCTAPQRVAPTQRVMMKTALAIEHNKYWQYLLKFAPPRGSQVAAKFCSSQFIADHGSLDGDY